MPLFRASLLKCVCGLALLVLDICMATAQTPAVREYQIKAVFLFNFTQFVEWPASSFPTDHSPFVIGIIGKDPFGSYLKEVVSGEKTNGHPIVVEHYANSTEIGLCHILFISVSEEKNLGQIIAKLKGQNVLLVSDSPDFLNQGGMIRFLTKNNRIQLQINLSTAKMTNLMISSKLLKLADTISSPQSQ